MPVCFFSGCSAACDEVQEKMPWVAACSIDKPPEMYGEEGRRKRYILEQRRKLKTATAKLAVSSTPSLFSMESPFECRVRFPGVAEARRHNRWGFRQSDSVLSFQAGTFLELYRNLLKVAYFNRPVYALRGVLLPLSRLVWRLQSRKHLPVRP
jgi:D-aminopeptidase